ncbi:MAG: hypothetical protein ACOC41_05225 [Chitinivibrionales bacterium]
MKTLELNDMEYEVLLETLENTLSDLNMEIADTHNRDYKEKLRERRRIFQSLLEKTKQIPHQV